MGIIKVQIPGLRGTLKDAVSVVSVGNSSFFNQAPQVTSRLQFEKHKFEIIPVAQWRIRVEGIIVGEKTLPWSNARWWRND